MPSKTIYLAGPTVFFPNHEEVFAHLKAICAKHGMVGISPLDNEVTWTSNPRETAAAIAVANFQALEQCSAVLADMRPFRGVEPDSGTCVEVGYAKALRKPVACYTGLADMSMLEQVSCSLGVKPSDEGYVDAQNGWMVENFDLPLNLMIAAGSPIFRHSEDAIKHLASQLAG